jgi:hypothetical protein
MQSEKVDYEDAHFIVNEIENANVKPPIPPISK